MAVIGDVVKVEWAPASDPFATSPTLTDITSQIDEIFIDRGRSGAFDLYGAGQCEITLKNNTPTIDPTIWYRWRQVKVTEVGGETLFKGFVSNITHDQSKAPFVARARIHATDALDVLSRAQFTGENGFTDLRGGIAIVVPEQRTGERIASVIISTGFPTAWKSIATGYVTMSRPMLNVFGVDVDGAINVNALQHAQDCAEAEVGGFYVAADGTITFEDRYELLERLNSAASAVFSDTATGTEVSYLRNSDLALTPPGTDYRNRVSFTADTGYPQIVSNIPANYPPDDLSRTLPMSADADALANATMLLEVYRQSGLTWPEAITVPLWPGFANNLAQVTALDLRRYCQVEFTPVGKTQQTYKVFVEHIQHRITNSRWTCRLGFSSADRWVSAWTGKNTYLILDDATYGKLDTAKIGP